MESFLNLAEYLFWFLIVLSVLVFVHEWGHYWVAKKCGVKIETFSIGFGPELFGWNDKSKTRWKFSVVPLGGYVKMFGDADPASRPDDENLQAMTEEEKKVAFFHQALWKRVAIVAAGPLANFIFALIILWGWFLIYGQTVYSTVIGEVLPDTPAEVAGFLAGDEILAVNGDSIAHWDEMSQKVKVNLGSEMDFTVLRDGEEVHLIVEPAIITQRIMRRSSSFGQIGITNYVPLMNEDGTPQLGEEGNQIYGPPDAWEIDFSFPGALVASIDQSIELGAVTMKAIGQLITGERALKELGGPIQIAEISGNMAEQGMRSLIYFMALLSINLGLINLFPIPVLDGGHLVFYAIEGIRGKPLSIKAQEVGFTIGIVLLATLMLFVFSNDILHLPAPSCLIAPAGEDCETLGEFGRRLFLS